MRLLVDLGNTRVKWRHDGAAGLPASGAQAHADRDFAVALSRAWRGLPVPHEVALACVGPAAAREALRAAVRRAFGDVPLREARTVACFGDLRIAYAEPSRLGVDRFLALIAAHRRAPREQFVIGIGTALTVDALGSDGRHHGGLIAPSPALMQRALVDATSGIRPTAPGSVVELACDTADAIASGSWLAAAGLIERMVGRAGAWAASPPAIVLHGGDARTLAGLLTVPVENAPDLVLDGLACWAGEAPAGESGDGRVDARR